MKRVWLIGLLVALVPSLASATDTRIQAMGGKEKQWTVWDESNVLFFPAVLIHWPNTIYVDAGLGADFAVNDADGSNIPYNVGLGVHYGFGPDTVVAFFGSSLSRQLSSDMFSRAFSGAGRWSTIGVDTEADEESGDMAIHNADHKGTFLVAQRFGAARAGLSVSIWGDDYTIDTPDLEHVKRGGTFVEGALGFGYDMKRENSVDVALRFHYGTFDDESVVGGNIVTRFKSDPHWGIGLLARGIFDIPGGEKIVPYLDIGTTGKGIEWNQANGVSDEFNGFNVTAGADLRIQPLEDVFLYPGLGLAVVTEEIVEGVGNDTETVHGLATVAPFVSAAVDARVASWFSVLFAGRHSVYFTNWDDGINSGSSSDTLTEFTLGMGLHFGNVDIELMVNPAWIMEGNLFGNETTTLSGLGAASSRRESDTAERSLGGLGSLAEGNGRFASQLAVKFAW